MSYEVIAILMFSSMMLMLLTGQRVFGAIGFVAVVAALALWGTGGSEIAFSAAMKLMKWYPLLTLPLFIYMGYMLSESGIAGDLYRMFHVWFGGLRGGLAVGTIGLMVAISAMNGLSVAGMAIGATIALPELLRRGYDKIMVTGVIQAGSSLGILVPPSVVLVLYGMIARQPVGQLWLAGVFPGLMMAGLFIVYIVVRCQFQPHLGPVLPKEDRDLPWREKLALLRAGLLPLFIFFSMTGLFLLGYTNLTESSAVGALTSTLAALYKRRLTLKVLEETLRKTLRRRVRRPRRGERHRGLLRRPPGPDPLGSPHPHAAQLPHHGDLPRRHRHAGDRRAALRAAGRRAGLQSHLVRHPLHHHLPDRLHDAALRLQPLPDARHGAQGGDADRHLPLDHPLRRGDDPRPHPRHGLPADRPLAAGALPAERGGVSTSGTESSIERVAPPP
jgi:hypothetical protein